MLDIIEDLRLLALRMTEHTVAMAEVALEFHKTNRNQAVEPSVGQCLYYSAKALLLNTPEQGGTLLANAGRKRLTTD